MYKVGDKVVHLSHGLGEVVNIEEREFPERGKEKFYILHIVDNGAPKKVFVPVIGAENRLRSVITRFETAKVWNALKSKATDTIDSQTWNRRYREYMEKIHTGNVLEVAEVLRSLIILKHDKDLSFGERKLLDQAKSLLVKELSVAENTSESEVESKLEQIFG
jgi:CarD family transcriptional regulator